MFDIIIDQILSLVDGYFLAFSPSRAGPRGGIKDWPNVLQRAFFPYRYHSKYYIVFLNQETYDWLDENIGRSRWRLLHTYYSRELRFRYKSDLIAYKLRWM